MNDATDADPDLPPWTRHLRPSLKDVSVYDVPPMSAPVRLHANECSQPWPPQVADALAEVIRGVELARYPDTSGRELRAVLADRHGCDAEQIVLGNGSDEVIALLLTALGGDGGAAPVLVVPTPTFVMYGHTARVLGYQVREVALDEQLVPRWEQLDAALDGATVCFIARPNNPTGGLWDAEALLRLMGKHPQCVFVIDEAYAAYAPGQSMWSPVRRDNHVHMATLSKVGLAALRVGYCIAHPALAGALNKVRHPYNISATSLALATAVLTRFADAQQELIDATLRGRERLVRLLASIPGATVFESHANFVLVRMATSEAAPRLRAFLYERGIVVKDLSSTCALAGCLRIGVGTPGELDQLQDALRSFGAASEAT